ncbi:MAG: hypothetical protein ACP5G5_07150 [Thermoplasmata archaeon]
MDRKILQAGNLYFYEDDLKIPLVRSGDGYKNAIFIKDIELKQTLSEDEMELIRIARDINRMMTEIEKKEKEANKTLDQNQIVNIKSEIADMRVQMEGLIEKYQNKQMELFKAWENKVQKEEKQMQPTTMPQPKEVPKSFTVSKGAISSIAKQYNIPDDIANLYFMLIDGQLYIKHPGLLYIASRIGYQRIEVSSQYNNETKTWEATAKVYPKIPINLLNILKDIPEPERMVILQYYLQPTIANATANLENVKNTRMYPFLKEMAETRAINRALRLYTGYGGTSFEELPDSEIENE